MSLKLESEINFFSLLLYPNLPCFSKAKSKHKLVFKGVWEIRSVGSPPLNTVKGTWRQEFCKRHSNNRPPNLTSGAISFNTIWGGRTLSPSPSSWCRWIAYTFEASTSLCSLFKSWTKLKPQYNTILTLTSPTKYKSEHKVRAICWGSPEPAGSQGPSSSIFTAPGLLWGLRSSSCWLEQSHSPQPDVARKCLWRQKLYYKESFPYNCTK